MAAPRKYPEELRERAIRLTLDARKDPADRPGACRGSVSSSGSTPQTLRGWVTQARDRSGAQARDRTGDAERIAELERDNRELRRANAILRIGVGFLRGGPRPPLPMIIDYIERYKAGFGVEPICTTLTSADVPIAPSTFYAARTRPPSARAVRDEELRPVIARVHKENYGVYGIRKMHAQLNRDAGPGWLPGGGPLHHRSD